MKRQFTATVYILEHNKVLLVYHKKLKKWLPAGGHVEPDEVPSAAAVREAKEETGLDIELLLDENIWVQRNNATSFARPFLCLLEEIPPHQDEPFHQHMDMVYVAKVKGGKMKILEDEIEDVAWFSLEEVEKMVDDEEIFAETKEVIREVFSKFSHMNTVQEKVKGKEIYA